MNKVIVITGASSGFGALTARALAKAGHIVYAGMGETSGRDKKQVEEAAKFATENKVDLRTIELDVLSETSVNAAIKKIIEDNGRLDVVIHNAGHMVFGPLEAFTPQQLAELYDVNVLSTQRVNRAALPELRKQKQGLVIWVSSSSAAGGTPPYLAPYFAAKAGMDALAVVSARELTRWGIETSIVVPGAFTGGTNHFAHSGRPADTERVAEYDNGPYKNFAGDVMKGFASIVPSDADATAVGDSIQSAAERHTPSELLAANRLGTLFDAPYWKSAEKQLAGGLPYIKHGFVAERRERSRRLGIYYSQTPKRPKAAAPTPKFALYRSSAQFFNRACF